ncbi:MAG TPA: N-acetylmuramoyl-L-alanine amidase, partial [Acidimicrobiales bacterium]|nr:N-acetylmuramoyl-L-alanine amidase [Acidimicrobiales bacterium]
MRFPLTIPRVLVALAAALAAVVLPIRTSWAEPAVRLTEHSAPFGREIDLAHPSSHLGVRWTGDETARLSLRWRADDGGDWQPWQPVVASHDLGDEQAGIHLSGLLIADDARHVELRVDAGAPRAARVVAIDTEHGPRRLVVERAQQVADAAANPAVEAPPIIPRAGWGADESLRSGTPQFAPITRFALHHTAAAEGPDPAATIRAILAYHTQTNGWDDIGYNFLVDSAGRVYEGRYSRAYAPGEAVTGEDTSRRGVTGAHTGNNNTGTVGVAILGDFTGALPTPAALSAVERLFAWKADRHDIDVLGQTTWSTGVRPTLIGHRDAVATACPGDALYQRLPAIRTNIASIVGTARAGQVPGYWTFGRDSSLYSFGDAPYLGGAGQVPLPVQSMAATPTGAGYWILSANGRVSAFGDARFHGSTEGMRLNGAPVRIEPTPSGQGYWILGRDGGVFSFGDAAFHGSTGSMRLNAPVISMAATSAGRGYWLLAGDGGVFSFGDAAFHGSTGSMRLNAPVASMAPDPAGGGYWLQATDGGIFSFGAVRFYGSVPGLGLQGTAATVQIRATPTGRGYYVLGADGG